MRSRRAIRKNTFGDVIDDVIKMSANLFLAKCYSNCNEPEIKFIYRLSSCRVIRKNAFGDVIDDIIKTGPILFSPTCYSDSNEPEMKSIA